MRSISSVVMPTWQSEPERSSMRRARPHDARIFLIASGDSILTAASGQNGDVGPDNGA
jgi:hypothetical protein